MSIQVKRKDLILILNHLLSMRATAFDAPSSSEQHWCTAIELFAKLLPGYRPTDPEGLYDFQASLLNQDVLYGRMSADDALKQLEQYQSHPQSLSAVLDSAGLLN